MLTRAVHSLLPLHSLLFTLLQDRMFTPIFLLSLFASFHYACAATAEQWRSRSIYQYIHSLSVTNLTHVNSSPTRLITDRFALPNGADRNACDPGKQTFCGGTWNTWVPASPPSLYQSLSTLIEYVKTSTTLRTLVSPPVSFSFNPPSFVVSENIHRQYGSVQ